MFSAVISTCIVWILIVLPPSISKYVDFWEIFVVQLLFMATRLQEHYEKQINELAGTCNSIGTQPPSLTPTTPRKLISLIPKSPLSKSSPSCSPRVKSLHTVESPRLKMPNTPTSVKPLHTIESPKFKMPKTPNCHQITSMRFPSHGAGGTCTYSA